MNNTILALEVLGKIISGMFLTPEGISILIFFGAFAAVMAVKIKLEEK